MSIDERIHAMAAEHNDYVSRETEHWLRRAIKRGAGWRVWRSAPAAHGIAMGWQTGTVTVTHRFTLLAPGDDAPGEGIVFEPPNDETKCPHPPCDHTIASFRERSACRFGGCPWGGDI